MPLSTKAVEGIKGTLDHFVKGGSPDLAFHAIDKSGKTLVEHASGTLGIDSSEPMDTQSTIFWIASCTKLVTAIAVLQLIEQGKVPLDDAEFVKKTVPELSEKKVYADGINGVEQEKGVTMRMLLSHTAGFGYRFADPRLQADGIEGSGGNRRDILDAKMVNQPGSMWEYGVNLDWAGIILERVTSTLKEREHLYAGPLSCTKENQTDFLQSGGAGLWSRPSEYVKILAALLNDGTSPQTQNRILKKESVDLMWENQIPSQPDFARSNVPPANPLLVNQSADMYPQPGNPPQGWGFGGFITIEPGPSGRGANTLWWMGLCNCFWWVDREKGVAGMLASQVLPNGDPKVIPAWFMAEKGIYDALE
ncbi:hypothetical protein G6011_05550 [Alternaria panax]|uniref:Beta-lactamase-related domain-containing protein n=1 Tax=Alternaria panax TaxID=48097 RepID=A0AAD4I925_9PLEO|nr:hypothetical protein G6011_05550 [Alternaria panax]